MWLFSRDHGKCLLLPPPSHPHRIRLASGDHGQFLLLPPPHRTWSAAGAHGNVAPPPNKNHGYAGAPSMYRGSGNQMKIVPSYIVHALVTSLYTTYIFRGFVKKYCHNNKNRSPPHELELCRPRPPSGASVTC